MDCLYPVAHISDAERALRLAKTRTSCEYCLDWGIYRGGEGKIPQPRFKSVQFVREYVRAVKLGSERICRNLDFRKYVI